MNDINNSNEGKKPRGSSRVFLWVALGLLVVVAMFAGGYFYLHANETRHLEEARRAISNSDWETATTSLEQALATQPGFVRQNVDEAIALRGFTAYQMGDMPTALADLDQSLDENPELFDLLAYRADIHFRQDDHELALKDGKAAIAQSEPLPDHLLAMLHANQAKIYYAASNDQGVFSEVEAAVNLSQHLEDDELAKLYALRSNSAYRLDDLVTAQEDARLAMSFDGGLEGDLAALIFANQAKIFFDREQYDQFMDASDQALDYENILSNETLKNLYLQRSQIFYDQGDVTAAISEAEQAASLGEDLAFLHALQSLESYLLFDEMKAMDEAETALALDEQNALAHRIRGALLALQRDAFTALIHLDKALELDPDDLDALTMSVQAHLDINQQEEAEAALRRAVGLAPNSPETLWAKAMVHESNREFEAAKNLIDQAIALDGNRPEFYTLRSQTYRLTEEQIDVKADLEHALELNPGFLGAQAGLIASRAAQFDYEDFEIEIQGLINEYPKWYMGHVMLAEYYLWVTGDLAQAATHAEKVVELRPESSAGYALQGYIYLEQNDYEQALEAFNRSLEAYDESIGAMNGLTEYYLAKNEFDKALATNNDLRRMDPEAIGPRVTQARVYFLSGDLQKAWIAINWVLADDPENPYALLTRAEINFQVRNFQEAMIDLSRVLDNYPLFAEALLRRSAIYSVQGEFDLAKQYANRTLEVDPSRGLAHGLLSEIAIAENDLEESLAQANRMIEKSPDSANGYLTQGMVNTYLERFDEAEASFSTGLEVETEDDDLIGQLTYQRALVNYTLGNKEQGLEDLQSVLEITSNVELLNETENLLANPSAIPVFTDGRVVIKDEVQGFAISFSTDWDRLVSEPENGHVLSLFAEEGNHSASVDVLLIEWSLDVNEFASAVQDALYDSNTFNSLSLDSMEIAGGDGLVRHYERILEDGTIVEGQQYYAVQDGLGAIIIAEVPLGSLDRFEEEFDEIAASFALLP